MSKNYLELGICKKPHGIRGGFLFYLYNTQDSSLNTIREIILLPEDSTSSINADGETHIIKSISIQNKTICYLENISDRNVVEAMIPFKIMIDRETLPETKDGEFYLSDLIGMKVQNEDGFEGEIRDCYHNGAQDVFVIKGNDGEEVDIPFTKDFFHEINLEEKLVIISLPEII